MTPTGCKTETVKRGPIQAFIHCCKTTPLVKILLWILLVTVITAAPVMMKLSFYSWKQKKIVGNKYTAPTSHSVSFFTSIWLGAGLSIALFGMKGFKEIWNIKSILLQGPVSVGYSASEALALYAMRTMDPIMYSVIHKIRLLLTAFFTRILLKRQVSFLVWVICASVTCCVLAFVLYAVHAGTQADRTEQLIGALLLVANITISVLCSIYGDWCYKKLPHPYTVQMAQGRVTACIGSVILALSMLTYTDRWSYGYFGGPGGGWDGMTVMFVFFLISRDWLTSWILKNLDALWKALAGSAAVATTYVVDILMSKKTAIPTQICLVCAIVCVVTIYALVKKLEKDLKDANDLNKELKKKVEDLASGAADAWKSGDTKV